MTTTTKKPRSRAARKSSPPLPPEASVVVVAGREYMLAPVDQYDEWLQDQILAAVAADRLEHDRLSSVPFDQAKKRLFSPKKSR